MLTLQNAQRQSCELEYFGDKMRSSGGSISDSSENLLHKDMGEGQGICSLGEGRAHAFKCRFFAEGYC